MLLNELTHFKVKFDILYHHIEVFFLFFFLENDMSRCVCFGGDARGWD